MRRIWDAPMYYPGIMHIHVLITKDQRNTSWNFAFHYKSDKLKKWKESLLISHACFWSSRKNVTEAKEKKCLFPSERPGEIFFPTMQSVIFFWNNKWIKKNIKHKKKTEKKKEKWDQSKKESLRYTCFNWCKCKCFS